MTRTRASASLAFATALVGAAQAYARSENPGDGQPGNYNGFASVSSVQVVRKPLRQRAPTAGARETSSVPAISPSTAWASSGTRTGKSTS